MNMNDEAYEALKEATLAAFDAYKTATKGRNLTDREIAYLFREISSITETLDFNQA